jgi:hypothetical protein
MKKITAVDFSRTIIDGEFNYYSLWVHRGEEVNHYMCHSGDSILKWMKKIHKMWIEA